MTSPETCLHLIQEELEAVSSLQGEDYIQSALSATGRFTGKKGKKKGGRGKGKKGEKKCSILTASGICYTSVFAPFTEQTSYGWGKGCEITSVPCPHSCMSSGHDLVY